MTKKKAVNAVDFDELQTVSNPAARNAKIGDSVKKAHYVSISDCIANASRGGLMALKKLEDQGKITIRSGVVPKWKLKCVKNNKGNIPKPGDRITWKRQLHNRREMGMGPKMGSVEIQDMIRRGDGDQIIEMGEAVLDSNLCFEVPYMDAAHLLSEYGIYYLSGYPLTPKKERGRDGTNNWRYMEVPPGWEEPEPAVDPVPEPDDKKMFDTVIEPNKEDPKPEPTAWEPSVETKEETTPDPKATDDTRSGKRPYHRRHQR